tara:strand:+ start:131 stop:802 length:672 start_codon:yes stop_codon:yes gene_type:complete
MKKILVVVAHPDDEVLGCGGTIAKFIKKKCEVKVLFLSDGESSRLKKVNKKKNLYRRACAIKAMRILGVKNFSFNNFSDNEFDKVGLLKITKKIESEIKKYNPDTILTHHNGDLNIDHQITSRAVLTACRPKIKNKVKLILFFEILSSTEWNVTSKKFYFNPNWYEDITKFMNTKMRAIRCYKKELRKSPHSRSLETIKALSIFRGSSSGVKNAEAFQLGRKI